MEKEAVGLEANARFLQLEYTLMILTASGIDYGRYDNT
jgi:hypothetical protein